MHLYVFISTIDFKGYKLSSKIYREWLSPYLLTFGYIFCHWKHANLMFFGSMNKNLILPNLHMIQVFKKVKFRLKIPLILLVWAILNSHWSKSDWVSMMSTWQVWQSGVWQVLSYHLSDTSSGITSCSSTLCIVGGLARHVHVEDPHGTLFAWILLETEDARGWQFVSTS